MNPLAYIPLSVGWAWLITQQTLSHVERACTAALNYEGLAPHQYRLLIPHALKPIADLTTWSIAVFVFWWLTLSFLMIFIRLIGREFDNDRSNETALFIAVGLMPVLIMFHPSLAHTNALEAVFIASAFLLILRGKAWPLYPLVMVATLNRETAVLIPIVYWLVTRNWKHGIGLGLVWAAVFVGLRYFVGPFPNHVTLAEIWAINMGDGLFRFALGLLILSPVVWYAWQGWRFAPVSLRRAGYAVPVYLAFVLVFGVWYELRLLFTVYPLLVPLVGFGIRPKYTRQVTVDVDWPVTRHLEFRNEAGDVIEVEYIEGQND